jgi:hypothetical protein
MELSSELIKKYFEFCIERHGIWVRRANNEPWPWTDDPILSTYKFTNVYRQLDTGTVWLTKNIIEPYAEHPELFFNIAAYRRYNYWPCAEVIGWIDDYAKQRADIVKRLRAYKADGGQIFTGAHMLNCQPGVDKITHVFEMVLPKLWALRPAMTIKMELYKTLENAYKLLLNVNGFGPFLSYEVVSDLRWTRYLKYAPDIMTWANAGPGAKRGIQRLLGIPVRDAPKGVKRPNDNEYLEIMRYLLSLSRKMLPEWMLAWEMREVEHTLCEFDKYMRAKNGEGRPRSVYRHGL